MVRWYSPKSFPSGGDSKGGGTGWGAVLQTRKTCRSPWQATPSWAFLSHTAGEAPTPPLVVTKGRGCVVRLTEKAHFHPSLISLPGTEVFGICMPWMKKFSDLFRAPDARSPLIWKEPDAGKDWRWEEKGTTEDEAVGWHHRLEGHEFEQALGDGDDREAWWAAVHQVAKSRTRRSTWTTKGTSGLTVGLEAPSPPLIPEGPTAAPLSVPHALELRTTAPTPTPWGFCPKNAGPCWESAQDRLPSVSGEPVSRSAAESWAPEGSLGLWPDSLNWEKGNRLTEMNDKPETWNKKTL